MFISGNGGNGGNSGNIGNSGNACAPFLLLPPFLSLPPLPLLPLNHKLPQVLGTGASVPGNPQKEIGWPMVPTKKRARRIHL